MSILENRALLTKYIHAPVFDFCVAQYLWDLDIKLCDAAGHGSLNTVKYLVSIGANIHIFDDYAFVMATHMGRIDTVKYLVSVGANIHAVDMWAPADGHLDTVNYIKMIQKSFAV